MGRLATDFYIDLYRSEGSQDMEMVLDTVPVKVTTNMNQTLGTFSCGGSQEGSVSDVPN